MSFASTYRTTSPTTALPATIADRAERYANIRMSSTGFEAWFPSRVQMTLVRLFAAAMIIQVAFKPPQAWLLSGNAGVQVSTAARSALDFFAFVP